MYLKEFVTFSDSLSTEDQLLLFDAQTSGGLLACVKADEAEQVALELKAAGVKDASIIGKVIAGEGIHVLA
jgi:selenide,water dikinase